MLSHVAVVTLFCARILLKVLRLAHVSVDPGRVIKQQIQLPIGPGLGTEFVQFWKLQIAVSAELIQYLFPKISLLLLTHFWYSHLQVSLLSSW